MIHVLCILIIVVSLLGWYLVYFKENFMAKIWGKDFLPFLQKIAPVTLIAAIAFYIFVLTGLIPT